MTEVYTYATFRAFTGDVTTHFAEGDLAIIQQPRTIYEATAASIGYAEAAFKRASTSEIGAEGDTGFEVGTSFAPDLAYYGHTYTVKLSGSDIAISGIQKSGALSYGSVGDRVRFLLINESDVPCKVTFDHTYYDTEASMTGKEVIVAAHTSNKLAFECVMFAANSWKWSFVAGTFTTLSSGGSGGATAFSELTDVGIVTPPNDGDIPVFSGSTQKWTPGKAVAVHDAMGPHRGWRLNILKTFSGTGEPSIYDLEFRQVPGVEEHPLSVVSGGYATDTNPAIVYSSQFNNNSCGAGNPFDTTLSATPGNRWVPAIGAALPQWLGYIFPVAILPKELRIIGASDLERFTLDYSDDEGASWHVYQTFTNHLVPEVDSTFAVRGRDMPAGGTTSQVLVKASGADFDVTWVDVAAGGSSSGGGTSEIGAHKYWMIANILVQSERDELNPEAWKRCASFEQLEFRASPGGAAQIPNGSASAPRAAGSVAMLHDGVGATQVVIGEPGATPSRRWVRYEYLAAVFVREVAVKKTITGQFTATQCPVGFDLYCSDDNQKWTHVTRFQVGHVWADAVAETVAFTL